MNDVAHADHRARDRARVTQIAFDRFDIEAREVRSHGRRANERANPVSRGEQRARNGGADEAGCAGQQHVTLIPAHPGITQPSISAR